MDIIRKEIKIDLRKRSYTESLPDTSISTSQTEDVKPSSDTAEYVTNQIDNRVDLLKSDNFITPQEYYQDLVQTNSVDDKDKEGYYILDPTDYYNKQNTGWFWIEDLKNWGRFYVDCITDPSVNCIILCIWNGKDGWIPIPDFYVNKYDFLNPNIPPKRNPDDYFGIAKVQDKITAQFISGNYDAEPLTAYPKNTIITDRGIVETVNIKLTENNESISGPVGTVDGFKSNESIPVVAQCVHAFRLQKSVNYSINEAGTFQTRRWNSTPISYTQYYPEYPKEFRKTPTWIQSIPGVNDPGDLMKVRCTLGISEAGYYRFVHPELLPRATVGTFANSNFRIGLPIGVPTVWRLPTGELALCTNFYYNSDSGVAYTYEKAENGFKKKTLDTNVKAIYSDPQNNLVNMPKGYNYETLTSLTCNKMLGHDMALAATWLNNMCAIYFGTGNDKTIEKDWLNIDTVEESAESYASTELLLLDSNKIFEQHNINKENSLKCTISVNRPVVTTEENPRKDYVKKW